MMRWARFLGVQEHYRHSALRGRLLTARRMLTGRAELHLYCVGTPKSGTHSIADIFAANYAARHEPGHRELVRALPLLQGGHEEELKNLFEIRRLAFNLDLESCHLLGPYATRLARWFPESRFILPVREPAAWLESMLGELDFAMRLGGNSHWWTVYDYYFGGRNVTFPAEERCLEQARLYPLDSMLGYWVDYHRQLIAGIPAARLLVLPTREIGRSGEMLARFSGVPAGCLEMSRSRSYVRKERSELLERLGQSYIESRLREWGGQIKALGLLPEPDALEAAP